MKGTSSLADSGYQKVRSKPPCRLQREVNVTRRRSKFGRCLAFAMLIACFCAPAHAQDAEPSNSPPAGRSNLVSADDLISTLQQDPDLLRQVKNTVLQKAQDQGRPLDSGELTDDALFQLIRDDRSVRTLVSREIEREKTVGPDDRDSAGPGERDSSSPGDRDSWGPGDHDYASPADRQSAPIDNRDSGNPDNRELSVPERGEYGSSDNRGSLGTGNRADTENRDGSKNREPLNPKLQRPYTTKRPPTRSPAVDQNQPATQGMRNPYPTLPSAKDLYRQFPSQQARLQRFGANIFLNGTGNTDILPMDLPAGPDYILGPGDGLFINLWGSVSQRINVTVDRGGQIALPEAGGVMVAGQTLAAAQQMIQRVLSAQFKSARIDVSLTRLRTVRVYVVGDVAQPGAYDISSLSTPLNALFAAGGPTAQGSLRTVRHYRGTQLIREVDLYDLILNGIRSDVERMQPGDSILVPPVGPQITVAGMVKRPAVYELRNERELSKVLELAGGVLVSATLRQIKVERIEAHQKRVMLSVNLPDGADGDKAALRLALGDFPVQDGDHVTIAPILPYSDSTIYLQGHVFRPGKYSYHSGMEIAEVLRSYQDLLPEPAEHAEIIRLTPPDYRPKMIEFKLSDVLGGEDPIELQPFDTIRIFGRYEIDAPKVSIFGEVLRPGDYPLSEGMTASALVRMAGGFKRSAVTHNADITTYVVEKGEQVITKHETVEISRALDGDAKADRPLQPGDVVTIHQLAGWKEVGASVIIKGEVRYPGTYGVEEGEKLSSLLKRAGGYREMAYPEGAVLERVQVREIAEKSRMQLIQQVETSGQNTKFPLGATAQEQAALMGTMSQQQENVLAALRKQPASGRLVINISGDIEKWQNTTNDIEVRANDVLTIPKKPNFIVVTGQVYNAAALTYLPGVSAGTYLRQAGGPTETANRKDIYVIRANGSVIGHGGKGSLFRGNILSTTLRRGDTIVVPEKIVGGTHAWKDVLDSVQLVSSLAIAARVATTF
jgi:protein involved in polysaccharide export with SLBB domain